MLDALRAALDAAAGDDQARCVLLQGDGDHFCAGADVGDIAAGAAEGVRYGAVFEDLLRAIEDHPLPVVAKVQGAALGAGCQILAACDLAVAADNAVIGVPSARLGLLLDLEKIQRMTRVWGNPVVREMLLAGRNWSGSEAAEWGMVTRSVVAGALDAAARELCEAVAVCAPRSVAGSKIAINAIIRGESALISDAHSKRALEALQSEDLKEGLAALRERRTPNFQGH